jgi:hypothetical protein
MCATLEAKEANIRCVVLTAGVSASRDVDAHASNLREAGLLKGSCNVITKTARLCDCKVAGIRTWARDDIACELCAGCSKV